MTDQHTLLMSALSFTEDDLDANRRGVLSERQREKLRKRRRKPFFILVITLALTFAGWATSHTDGSVLVAWLIIWWFAAGSLFAVYALFETIPLTRALRAPTIMMVSGPVQFHETETTSRGTMHTIIVATEEFKVDERTFSLFWPGEYCLYYGRGMAEILSAYRVDASRPAPVQEDPTAKISASGVLPPQALNRMPGFSAEDLAVNRLRALSDVQSKQLKWKQWLRAAEMAFYAEIILIVVLFTPIVLSRTNIDVLQWLVCLVVIIGFLFYPETRNVSAWLNLRPDLAKGQVETVVGYAQHTSISRRKRPTIYTITVEGRTFHVHQLVYQAIDSDQYRIYYLPNSMTLVSAERSDYPDEQSDTNVDGRTQLHRK